MGLMGACWRDELYRMTTSDFQDLGEAVMVQIPRTKNQENFQ